MRILALLLVVAAIYLLVRHTHPTQPPIATPPQAQTAAPSADAERTNVLKRPLDVTREALEANKKRTSEGF